jgi:hypothetical protein
LLEKAHGVIDHVCALGELILGSLNFFDREERRFNEMGKQGEHKMTVQVGDYRFRQVVFGHFLQSSLRGKKVAQPELEGDHDRRTRIDLLLTYHDCDNPQITLVHTGPRRVNCGPGNV